jgi:hypothetical protein
VKPNRATAFFVGWLVYVVGTTVRAMDGILPFIGSILFGPFVVGAIVGVGLLLGHWALPRLKGEGFNRMRLLCCATTGLGALSLLFASQFDFMSDKERVMVDDYINVIRPDVAVVSFTLLVWGVLFFPVKPTPPAGEALPQSE